MLQNVASMVSLRGEAGRHDDRYIRGRTAARFNAPAEALNRFPLDANVDRGRYRIGLWEVPVPVQKAKAHKLFKKLNVRNIHVKVVEP